MSLKSITVVIRETITHTITIDDYNSDLGSVEGLVDTIEFVNEIRDMHESDLIETFKTSRSDTAALYEHEVISFEMEENK